MDLGNDFDDATNSAGSSSANIAGGLTGDAYNNTNDFGSGMPNQANLSSVTTDNGALPSGNEPEPLENKGKNLDKKNEEALEGATPGTKVEPGKEVGKDGKVKDTSTKKLTTAVGQGAAAYFTGGESLGKDQAIKNNRLADRAIGVVSDVAEKSPGIKEAADELDEAGVIDAATDAMDLVGDIKNGDIDEAVDKAKDLAKDTSKMQKHALKKMLPIIIISAAAGLLFIVLIIGIVSPIAGGIMDLTEKVGELFDAVGNFIDDHFGGSDAYDVITDLIEDYDNLSEEQKKIVITAASALGQRYNWGGHPTGPGYDGFPSTGLDCGGFVQWVLWTAYGVNPGYLTTSSISDLIGTKFQEISKDQLQPGDIGLKFRGSKVDVDNHTGIYVGKGNWIHAAGSKHGVINSKYKSFTIYVRYVG